MLSIIYFRNEIQKLLKANSLIVYESIYVESVDLLYKICRGALRGPCQNTDFIYPGRKYIEQYKIISINIRM